MYEDEKQRVPSTYAAQTVRVIRFLEGVTHKDLVPYGELTEAIGFDIRTRRWNYASAKRALRRRGVAFGTINGKGIKRLTSEEGASELNRDRKSIGRKSRRTLQILDCIDTSELTETDLRSMQINATLIGLAGQVTTHSAVKKLEAAAASTNKLPDQLSMLRLLANGSQMP